MPLSNTGLMEFYSTKNEADDLVKLQLEMVIRRVVMRLPMSFGKKARIILHFKKNDVSINAVSR